MLSECGIGEAGYLAALADQVLAFATMSVLPDDQMFRTVGLSVQFFRGSRNERITIEARVVAQSPQLVSVEAEFHNPDGELLAKATAQQMLMPIPERLRAGQTA